MENWIEVSPAQPSLISEKERIRGEDVTVYVSPYNAPKALRSHIDQASREFVIDFRYIDEPEDKLQVPKTSRDGMVKFYLGKNSGRIEAIRVAIELLDKEDLALKIRVVAEEAKKGITELRETEQRLSRRLSFIAARNAIEEVVGKLGPSELASAI